nr:MAG TPA: structural protein [Caudoviricetes sp.]
MPDNNLTHPIPLPPRLKTFAYDYDPTGKSVHNRIVNEAHTITPENRSRFNVIIPSYAPFFRNSLEIVNQQTGQRLIESIDFTCEWRVVAAQEKTEHLRPIYGGIQFIDSEITGTFLITYQTIGGQFTIGSTEIAQALANQANDPLVTNYDDIIGKPLVFPPLEHVHSIKDFIGFDHIKAVLESIREAIIALAREDRDSHPGYDTLVDEYFRLSEALNGFTSSQIEFKKNLTAELDKVKKELTGKIEVTINEINTLLREKVADIDNRLSELTALVNSKLKELTDNLKRDFEAYKTSSTQRIDELSIQISDNKQELATIIQQNYTTVQQTINTAKTDLDRKLETFKNEVTRDQARQDQKMTELESKINEFGNSSGIVRTTGDQVIHGQKKFTKAIMLTDENGEYRAAIRVHGDGSLLILNKGTNSTLEFQNDRIMYKNDILASGLYVQRKVNGMASELEKQINALRNELNILRGAVNQNTEFRESIIFVEPTTLSTNNLYTRGFE